MRGNGRDGGPIRFDEPGPSPSPSPSPAPCAHGGELRCGCGSLLARVVDGSVELKCRRCKRTWIIPIESP